MNGPQTAAGGPTRLDVSIRRDDVLHFLGYPAGHRPPERVERRLAPLLDEARALVSARGAWRHLGVAQAGEVGLEAMPAAGLVIGLVTVGDGIEARATDCMARGDATGALLLDAMGSAAVEEAADRLGVAIVGGASRLVPDPAPAPSCRISPGYGSWPIEAQAELFARLPAGELGVSLLPTMLMLPRKSVSFAMWMGADARPLAGLSGCRLCKLAGCRYRTAPPGAVEGPP